MEFLDDPFDNEASAGVVFENIALVSHQLTWQVWDYDNTKYFHFDGSKTDMYRAKREAAEYAQTLSGTNIYPSLGVLVEIPVLTNLTVPDSFDRDDSQFYSSYYSEKIQLGENGKLTAEEQDRVTDMLPYDEIVNVLRKFPQAANNQVWARYENKINQVKLAKGETYKDRPIRYVYVVTEIFADETAARLAAGVSAETEPEDVFDEFYDNATPTPPTPTPPGELSDLAKRAFETVGKLIDMLPSIEDDINAASKFVPKAQAVISVCKNWGIEASDLNIARAAADKPF